MKVLAADDDPTISATLARLLHRWGYEVQVAHDGLDAWQQLKQDHAPSVVILDWDMPGLSGVEVCRLLRSIPKGEHAYVLMLTGRQHKDDLVAALESGADDFLSKPFDARELKLRLAKGVRDLSTMAAQRRDRSLSSGAPPSGSSLGGKYRLERKIADGGMGSVWLGVHLSLGVNVAIKFMRPELAETADYASFEREARAAAQLRNEHIVRVYDHGMTEDGAPYLVMEYLCGESLAARIERLGPLPAADVVSFVDQASAALAEAHGRGIIHRDVKPENVLLEEDVDRDHGFRVKLIDFGLAKRIDHRDASEGLKVAGTPRFMSPEYLGGDVPPDPLLDLWGLAACAFSAMTGQIPFDGGTLHEVVMRVCDDPLPVPSKINPNVSPGFDEWFARACARKPSARFQTAGDLAAGLKATFRLGAPEPRPSIARPRDPVSFAPTEPDSGESLKRIQSRPTGG